MGGLGGSKSPDNADIMREIEQDSGTAHTGMDRVGEAMTGTWKEIQVRYEQWDVLQSRAENGRKEHVG